MAILPDRQKSKKFVSLTETLTNWFLFLGFTTILVSSALNLYFSFIAQQQSIVSRQAIITQDASSRVHDFIVRKFSLLETAANLTNLSIASPEDQKVLLSKLLGKNSDFKQLFILDAQGHILEHLSRLIYERGSLATSTLQAEVFAQTKKGNTYIGPVYIDDATGELLILVAVPTRDRFQSPQGALVAEVNLKFMWDLVGAIQVGQKGVVYVVDEGGDLIAFGDSSRVLAHENLGRLSEVSQFIDGALHTNTAEISRGILGTYVVSGFERLGTPDWAVVVEMPLLEAYAPIMQAFGYSLLVMLFGILFAWILGSYISKQLTARLLSLTVAAKEISAGNLDTELDLTSENTENEIEQLFTSFRIMTSRLKELYTSMDTKIKEKTFALSNQVTEVEKSKIAILNLLEDIETEKKKVEQTVVERTRELREEKARLLASINSLSFGFVIADLHDNVIVKNAALSTILELTEEPTSIRNIVDSFKGVASELDVLTHSCRECIDLKKVVELKEISHAKKYLRVFCTPVIVENENTEDSEKKVIGYVVLIEDVTEAKIMERSRDEFFAIASHELRTPLTAIRGNADMILDMYADKVVDKDMKEMLQDIDTSSIRLISIVNDFLEVSRIEQGRIEINKEKFNVSDVAEKVVRDLKSVVEQKGLLLVYTPPPSPLPEVFADKNRTEQILINLVGNAVKFTKEGSVIIATNIADGFVGVRVTDTGLGISEHNQNLLFRKFQQAGEQMLARDVTQSTGLGLYISKLIIASMGGTIGLEKSELGKGSTFIFTLPIATDKI